MAGTLPDVPGHRFALDADGSIFMRWDSSNPANAISHDADAAALQDDNDSTHGFNLGNGTNGRTYYPTVIFPEPRNLSGFFIRTHRPDIGAAYYTPGSIQVSTDTTNGLDGTWTVAMAASDETDSNKNRQRANIRTLTAEGIQGIRFPYTRNSDTSNTEFRITTLHLYGTIPTGANDQRIAYWHGSEDQEIGYAYFDLGDFEVGDTATKSFRLKNLHGSLAANSIAIDVQDLNSGANMGEGMSVSTDGVVWMSTINIGDLAPGQVSAPLYVRFQMPSLAVNPYSCRLRALPGSWS